MKNSKLRDGDIGITGDYQFFAVKRHIDANNYQCYWGVFVTNSSNIKTIRLKPQNYFVHRKATPDDIKKLKSFLFEKGYFLKDNKIIKCDEF